MPRQSLVLPGIAAVVSAVVLLVGQHSLHPAWADEAQPLAQSNGQFAPPDVRERIDQEGFRGTLILAAAEQPSDSFRDALLASLPKHATVAVVAAPPTNPSESDLSSVITRVREWLSPAQAAEDEEAAEAMAIEFVAAVDPADIDQADAIWLCESSGVGDRAGSAGWADAITRLLRRGGTVAACGAPAAWAGAARLPNEPEAEPQTAWGLLPDAIIALRPEPGDRVERLRAAVAARPGQFAIAIDEPTTTIVRGRRWEVLGEGSIGLALAASNQRPPTELEIPAGSLADLTQLRRAARWRAAGIDPGEPTLGPPTVPSGSLVIVGGGGMPQPIVDRFVELAGGRDAKIVVLPTAVPRDQAFASRPPRFLTRAGVASVKMLPQSRTDEVTSDEFREALAEATGVWFDGGRQWNFVDAYENTAAVDWFHDVLRRGGVIGGSSAGATIQGEYLVRGHPLGNQVMMAEGYERGFGFLPGAAIDQHFSQRRRHADLLQVVRRHPKLVGIGIDEATALVVTGSQAEVIGEFSAHFLTGRTLPVEESGTRSAREAFLSVPSGRAIDLTTLELLPAPEQEIPEEEKTPTAESNATSAAEAAANGR